MPKGPSGDSRLKLATGGGKPHFRERKEKESILDNMSDAENNYSPAELLPSNTGNPT